MRWTESILHVLRCPHSSTVFIQSLEAAVDFSPSSRHPRRSHMLFSVFLSLGEFPEAASPHIRVTDDAAGNNQNRTKHLDEQQIKNSTVSTPTHTNKEFFRQNVGHRLREQRARHASMLSTQPFYDQASQNATNNLLCPVERWSPLFAAHVQREEDSAAGKRL